jgi:hypothetical protein
MRSSNRSVPLASQALLIAALFAAGCGGGGSGTTPSPDAGNTQPPPGSDASTGHRPDGSTATPPDSGTSGRSDAPLPVDSSHPVDGFTSNTTPGATQVDAGDGDAVSHVTPVSGLMMRDGLPPYGASPPGKETFITSSVMQLNWVDIEGTQGTFVWSTLDTALMQLGDAHVTDIKIRLLSGGSAPGWAKQLGSTTGYFNSPYGIDKDCGADAGAEWGGVAVENVQGPTQCIPFFWTTEYQAAYDSLMQHLAMQLASDPKYAPITTIVDSSCMAVYAEVFYRGQSFGPTNHTLAVAPSTVGGLTPALDWACQKAAIMTHQKWFGATHRTALAINDWDLVQSAADAGSSYRIASWSEAESGQPGTLDFLNQVAIPALGSTLEVQNNGLHSDSGCSGSADSTYFCYIASYPGRRGFQTETYVPNPDGGASETLLEDLQNGLKMNASFIELPDGMSDTDWTLMPCYQTALLTGGSGSSCAH